MQGRNLGTYRGLAGSPGRYDYSDLLDRNNFGAYVLPLASRCNVPIVWKGPKQ